MVFVCGFCKRHVFVALQNLESKIHRTTAAVEHIISNMEDPLGDVAEAQLWVRGGGGLCNNRCYHHNMRSILCLVCWFQISVLLLITDTGFVC